jgi:hypothetical protein
VALDPVRLNATIQLAEGKVANAAYQADALAWRDVLDTLMACRDELNRPIGAPAPAKRWNALAKQ